MESIFVMSEEDVERAETRMLVSPKHPSSPVTVFLSNLDQTVAFPVETVYFYAAMASMSPAKDMSEVLERSITEVLVPYYFMAGRITLNQQTNRLELLCNNAGVHFSVATCRLRLRDLGDLSCPNPSFHHLLLRTDGFRSLCSTPLLTVQITRFMCGGCSVGFVTNHSILDGWSAVDFFENLASCCRGEGLKTHVVYNDRTCFRARDPPEIKYPHKEYTKLTELNYLNSSFTSSRQSALSARPLSLQKSQGCRLFHFTDAMLCHLKWRASVKCSTFEAVVAQIWRARTRAVFQDASQTSSVLFAVDIRSRVSPPLPPGFTGNAVITARASATVVDIIEKPFSFCVKMLKEAIVSVTDEYVKSAIDWLEVYRGIPSTSGGNFYVSAWWKLPFFQHDMGYGKPMYAGPVVSSMNEFVLLLSGGEKITDGLNVWVVLEKKMLERLAEYIFHV